MLGPVALLLVSLCQFSQPAAGPVPAAEPGADVPADPTVAGVPAQLVWGDFDRDGLADALALDADGGGLLLRNRGDGSFEDGSAFLDLREPVSVSCAAWGDLDGDGWLDLLLGERSGGVRLLRNGRPVLYDVGGATGLQPSAPVQSAAWIDFDGDGWQDLQLVTAAGTELSRNQGDGRFLPAELPEGVVQIGPDSERPGAADDESPATSSDASTPTDGTDGTGQPTGGALPKTAPPLGGAPTSSLTGSLAPAPPGTLDLRPGAEDTGLRGTEESSEALYCPLSLADTATGSCVQASSLPQLGKLYPLGPELNIDGSGRVGVGTTSPLYRLHVVEGADTGIFGQGGTTGVRGDANLAGTGNRYGGYFSSSGGSNNIGVQGVSTIGVYGIGTGIAVLGDTNVAAGIGVQGRALSATGVNYGVKGSAVSPTGVAILGEHLASTGVTAGVHGTSASSDFHAPAVRGDALLGVGANIGVRGTTASTIGYGVRGDAFASSGASYGVSGTTASPDGVGVVGDHPSTTGTAAGVHGRTLSGATGAAGVRGEATSTIGGVYGVLGTSASDLGKGVVGEAPRWGVEGIGTADGAVGVRGRATLADPRSPTIGVSGRADATTQFGTGVSGGVGPTAWVFINSGVSGSANEAVPDGAGVAGYGPDTTGASTAVYGLNDSPTGTGVRGDANDPTGAVFGVRGTTVSDLGIGVRGESPGTAVEGISSGEDGVGVVGRATLVEPTSSAVGVWGLADATNTNGIGVAGTIGPAGLVLLDAGVSGGASDSSTSVGVAGYATDFAFAGVHGVHPGLWGTGVMGEAEFGVGVFGDGATGVSGTGIVGVYGESASGYGVWGESVSGYGVYGIAGGVGGYGVFSSGHFGGTGNKYFVQPHPTDASREIRFVCLEGNESGTYFRGSSRLEGGVVVIEVPEEFRLASEPGELTVQVTPRGPVMVWCESVDLEQVVIRGSQDVAFDYFVNGVRRGYAGHQAIVENDGYVPKYRGVPFGTQHPEGIQRMLVENGTLNADLTPNEATATRLGWTLREQPRSTPRAGDLAPGTPGENGTPVPVPGRTLGRTISLPPAAVPAVGPVAPRVVPLEEFVPNVQAPREDLLPAAAPAGSEGSTTGREVRAPQRRR